MTVVVTPRAGSTHDVTLQLGSGGDLYGFMADLNHATEERANAVVASARIGTDPELSEGLLLAWTQDDYSSGIDLFEFDAEQPRLWWADGRVQTWKKGRVGPASAWTASDASAGVATAPMIVDMSVSAAIDYVLVGVGTLLRLYDDSAGTWANEGTFASNALWLHLHNDLLYVACGSGDDFWRFNGTKTTGWAQPSVGIKANGFTSWDEKLWLWTAATIRSSTDDGVTWAAAINVGDPGNDIRKCYPLGDVLMINKPEGFYYYDGTNVVPIWTESIPEDATRVGNTGCEWNGFGYTNIKETVRKFAIGSTTDQFTDVTPLMEGDESKELYGHGLPVWAFAGPKYLYVAFKNGEGPTLDYPELLMWTDVGWHQIYRGTSAATLAAAGYSNMKAWLMVNCGGVTYRKRISDVGQEDLADYPTATDCQIITPWFDAGLMATRKEALDLLIFTRNCSTTRTIKFEYEINRSGTWVTIGTVTSNPLLGTRFMMAGLSGAVANMLIRLRITFVTDSATLRPVLEKFAMRYIPMQDSQHLYHLRLRLGSQVKLLAGYEESRSVDEQLNFLGQVEDWDGLILLTDRFGRIYRVKNTNYRGDWPMAREDRGEEVYKTLTFVDMFPGTLTGQLSVPMSMAVGWTASVVATTPAWLLTGTQSFVASMNSV